MRRTALALSMTAVLGVAPVLAQPAQAATPRKTYGSEILRLTNVARAHHHLPPLKPAICADRFAARWTRHLAAVKTLSHQDTRVILATCHASYVGENVAYGNVTPAQLLTMWMNSPKHRANILNPKFTYLGVAAVRTLSDLRVYATQDFIRAN